MTVQSRAREGVRLCVELMSTGKWIRGVTAGVVAEEFGVELNTVEHWASEASRFIRMSIEGDREEIRARMISTLDSIISRATKKEARAAVSAIELQAKLLGLLTHQVQVSGSLDQMIRGEEEDRLRVARSVVAALESAKKGRN